MEPAIVVSAYNRPDSLRRVLGSLAAARVPVGTTLIISIDRSETVADAVLAVAEGFCWPHGDKRIISHPARLGLRQHILHCGDLTETYGAIIMIEDDLYVSPEFYQYTLAAIAAYEGDPEIGGISLYNHRCNETANMGFQAIEDGFDCYFMQMASSWGQCWTREQWRAFRDWYDQNHEASFDTAHLPADVLSWRESSWKKYFVKYLVVTGRCFVYARISLTTNFMDAGTHHKQTDIVFQVPLLMAPKTFRFAPLRTSSALYDSHCEILPAALKRMAPALAPYDFEVDLYGRKEEARMRAPYVLTSRKTRAAVMRFGLAMKPHELNITHGIEGTAISLARLEDRTAGFATGKVERLCYYHDMPPGWLVGLGKAEARLKTLEAQSGSLRWLAHRALRVMLRRLGLPLS